MPNPIIDTEVIEKDSQTGKYYLVKKTKTQREITKGELIVEKNKLIKEKDECMKSYNKMIARLDDFINQIGI
ncbi:MAG: hypothetical protein HYS80_02260 [Candidatus Aenigmarchaeota archaeon]|nr:hypothetical protein [Candidatus Aenigmarchaeota archaeon]